MIILTIPEIPVSLNQILNWHWAKRKENKEYWETLILAEVRRQNLKKIKGMVKIKIIYIFKNKRLHDYDNLLTKGILDGLKKYLIQDDSTQYISRIELSSKIEKGEKEKTIIMIEAENG